MAQPTAASVSALAAGSGRTLGSVASGGELATELEGAADTVAARLSDWGAAPLKRVPKPFDPEHPQAELLKRKTLIIEAALPDEWQTTGLVNSAGDIFAAMLPLWRVLDDGLA